MKPTKETTEKEILINFIDHRIKDIKQTKEHAANRAAEEVGVMEEVQPWLMRMDNRMADLNSMRQKLTGEINVSRRFW